MSKRTKIYLSCFLCLCAIFTTYVSAGEITETCKFYARNVSTVPRAGSTHALTYLTPSAGGYSAVIDPVKTLATTLVAIQIPDASTNGTLYYSYTISTVGAATWDFRTLDDSSPVGTMDGGTLNVNQIQRLDGQGILRQDFTPTVTGDGYLVTVARQIVIGADTYANTLTNTLGASSSSAMVLLSLRNITVTTEGFDAQIYAQLSDINSKLDTIGDDISNLPEQERQAAAQQGQQSTDSAAQAFGNYFNFAENTGIWGYLTSLYNAINHEQVITTLTVPSGDLKLSGTNYHFWDSFVFDFAQWLDDPSIAVLITIGKGLQVVAAGGVVIYYAFKLQTWINGADESTEDIASDIPILPGGGGY